ncbi:MAG: toll/interleukin-1 receptor domain-containing protein [Chlorobiaceae bacterium]
MLLIVARGGQNITVIIIIFSNSYFSVSEFLLPACMKKDFFISYNGADKQWAEWIAWQLIESGYTVIIQAWDFRAGGNFILEMHRAAIETDRTIAVLSSRYLQAFYTQPEWAAALVHDADGKKRLLIPVRIDECQPDGLFASLIYLDLVGLTKTIAKECLLTGHWCPTVEKFNPHKVL